MRIRSALQSPEIRFLAAQRYAQRTMADGRKADRALRSQLQASALKGLTIFAGDGDNSGEAAGYLAVSRFLEKIPPQDQEKAIDIFMKILNGSRSEEHTSELQSLMRISYAVFCLKKKKSKTKK